MYTVPSGPKRYVYNENRPYEHPFKDLEALFIHEHRFRGKTGLFNDIFSRDIFYCLLQEIETLKTSILRENEICQSRELDNNQL